MKEELDVLDVIDGAKAERKLNVDELIIELKNQYREPDKKKIAIPEEIALKFESTYKDLLNFIKEEKGILERHWVLYKEALKVKFALSDKETMGDMKMNYELGTDSKSFPSIGFFFKGDDISLRIIDAIVIQTQLQREKNLKEAKSMGIDIMSSEEKIKLEETLSEIDREFGE